MGSYVAFDLTSKIGGALFRNYLSEAIQFPISDVIQSTKRMGWLPTPNNDYKVFVDSKNTVFCAKEQKYLSILESRLLLDPSLPEKWQLSGVTTSLPILPAEPFADSDHVSSALGIKAYGELSFFDFLVCKSLISCLFRDNFILHLMLVSTAHVAAAGNLDFVKEITGTVPHYILSGDAGNGKTTAVSHVIGMYGCNRNNSVLMMSDLSTSAYQSVEDQMRGLPKSYVFFSSDSQQFD